MRSLFDFIVAVHILVLVLNGVLRLLVPLGPDHCLECSVSVLNLICADQFVFFPLFIVDIHKWTTHHRSLFIVVSCIKQILT